MNRFILADLRRLWAGSFVVVLLVTLATALGVAITLQERALRLGSARAADRFDLVIGAAGSETQLVLSSVFLQPSPLPLVSGEVLEKLTHDPRVAWAAPVGFGDSFSGYQIVGTTTSLVKGTTTGFSEGHAFTTQTEAVIGSAVNLPMGAEIKPLHGDATSGGHTHTEIAYTVSGKLNPTGTAWDRAILVPIRAVWSIHGMGHEAHEHGDGEDHEGEAGHEGHTHGLAISHDHEDHDNGALEEHFDTGTPDVPAILVKPKSIADAYKLRQEYRAGSTLGVFPGEVLTRLYATLGDARRILAAVAAGAQVLVAAALLLVTVVHIGQRRRQIGALRAFGAPRIAVFSIVWIELFALFAAGIAAGFVAGFAAAKFIGNIVASESGVAMPVEFARADAAIALVFLGVAAFLAAIPAILAYRQSPAAALRA